MPLLVPRLPHRYRALQGSRVWRSLDHSHGVNFGSDARLDDTGSSITMTLGGWVFLPAAPAVPERIAAKDGGAANAWRIEVHNTSGDLRLIGRRGTTNLQYQTTTTPFGTLNRWLALIVTYNSGAGAGAKVAIWRGTEHGPPVAQTMSVGNEGSGTFFSDAAYDLCWAFRSSSGSGMPAIYGPFAYWTRVLTAAEIAAWWAAPWSLASNPVVCAWPDASGWYRDLGRHQLHGQIAGGVFAPAPPWLVLRHRARWYLAQAAGGGLVRSLLDRVEAQETVRALRGLVRAALEGVEARETVRTLRGLLRAAVERVEARETVRALRGLLRAALERVEARETVRALRGLVRSLLDRVEARETVRALRGIVRAHLARVEARETWWGLLAAAPGALVLRARALVTPFYAATLRVAARYRASVAGEPAARGDGRDDPRG